MESLLSRVAIQAIAGCCGTAAASTQRLHLRGRLIRARLAWIKEPTDVPAA